MSFLTPLFLLGLAAIAAPIIVHLVRRTKAPRVEFPSLMFVRRVPQRTIRRRQVQNLLLLILRCLAFGLLALAFVRPYFDSAKAGWGEKTRATVLLLDNSFSMRLENRFEQVKSRAQALIGESRGNDQLAIVAFNQGFEVINRFSADTSQLKASLGQLQPGYNATDYVQALRGAESLLREVAASEKRIYLISDFQATGLPPTETAFRLSQGIKLEAIDLGEPNRANVTVTDLGATSIIYQPKYTEKLTARLANFGTEEKSGIQVEFLLNDRTVEKREIKIPARDFATVEFTGFNLNEGINQCAIQLSGDDVPLDNRFYFTLRRANQAKALGIETATRGRSESFYLRNALTTGENIPFDLELKTAGSVNPSEVSSYQVVVINDATISPALAAQIVKQVESGGGLIIAAGLHTEAATFNQVFQNVAPATLDGPAELRGNYVALSEIKADHPIFEIFRQSGRLASAKVFGYQRARPRENATVLARYEDGSPALIETLHGKGKILLFTSTLDASWNDLPLKSLYLPFLRQMTRYLAEREEQAWHPVGQVFAAAAAPDGSAPAVDTPGGARLTGARQTASGETMIAAAEPGFYRLRYPAQAQAVAVNVNSRESDLAKLDLQAFLAGVTGSVPETSAEAQPEQVRISKEETEARQRFWLYLLLAALAFFIAEGVLARRIKMAKVIN